MHVSPPSLEQPTSIGRYVIFGQIAAGGMAAVHYGLLNGAAGFRKPVAIKRWHAGLAADQGFVEQFLDEAHLAARIRNPHVVQTLDVVSDENELLLVMEYVAGETVATLLRRLGSQGQRMPVHIAVGIVVGALRGLHAAHEAQDENGTPLEIVHRDVSPQNIIVGRDGVARVLDFGVAKAAARIDSTADGKIKGKLRYMSPEQFSGTFIDRRTDVFAAAIVLWEMLVGRRLFDVSSTAMKVGRPSCAKFSVGLFHPRAVSGRISPLKWNVPLSAPWIDGSKAERRAPWLLLRSLSRSWAHYPLRN